jgi:hypothetical protein
MAGRIRLDLELTPAELADFTRIEPPAFLDALVKQRAGDVLERRRSELAEASADAPAASGLTPVASRMSGAEVCAYAFGLLAYGIQLADGVARLIWHAMTG